MRIAFSFLMLVLGFTFSCSPENQKKQQYISYGRLVYQKQCANCHQDNGNGYEKLYPPINNSDIFNANQLASICTIYYGSKNGLRVNNETYSMEMPKFDHLKADELAKLLTYISNAWDNEGRLYTEEEIIETLKNCSNK